MRDNKNRIEIRGLKARLYDVFLSLGTLGLYNNLIQRVIRNLRLKPYEKILDMGAGSGKNAIIMLKYLSEDGEVAGLEIGKEMQVQFRRKSRKHRNMKLYDMRIEDPLPFESEFDRVFISFVMHGFNQEDRIAILRNGQRALKPGGIIHIFDWNEFYLDKSGLFLRLFFKFIECPEAKNFIRLDLKKILLEGGFVNPEKKTYAKSKIRLLTAQKP